MYLGTQTYVMGITGDFGHGVGTEGPLLSAESERIRGGTGASWTALSYCPLPGALGGVLFWAGVSGVFWTGASAGFSAGAAAAF